MDAAKGVGATFAPITYDLTVTTTGSGTVTSAPAGIACGADCTETYANGTAVTLTATAAAGYVFGGWSGACSGTGPCTVTMDAAQSVGATFGVSRKLTVTRSGSGTVTGPGINCGGGDCTENYADGTLVTLVATPAANYGFAGWSGACTGTGGCTLTMDAAKTVTATFTLLPKLTVARTGSGTVTGPGITCGADCNEFYPTGTPVTLTATPAANYGFAGWSGACTGTGDCTLTMDAAKSVRATFTLLPKLTVTRSGSGTVTGPGINCTGDCTEYYPSGTLVTLTATPAVGSVFTGWSGACTGTGDCTLTMDAAKSVRATFALLRTLTVTRTGNGTVTGPGIDCGADCTEAYANGTVVTLTATPAAGSVFSAWSGACTGSGACTVTMSAARSVKATFVP